MGEPERYTPTPTFTHTEGILLYFEKEYFLST